VPPGNPVVSLTCSFRLRGWRGEGWLARVLLKIACLLMRWLFSLAVLVSSGDRAKNAELLVLRHQNAVLRRNAGRVQYEPGDRAWFAALTRFIPRRHWAGVFPVTPTTLLAWHRRLAARKYDTSKRRRPGRPPTARSTAPLTIRLAHQNPLWATGVSTASWPGPA
jgi:putative transposase